MLSRTGTCIWGWFWGTDCLISYRTNVCSRWLRWNVYLTLLPSVRYQCSATLPGFPLMTLLTGSSLVPSLASEGESLADPTSRGWGRCTVITEGLESTEWMPGLWLVVTLNFIRHWVGTRQSAYLRFKLLQVSK